jgi:hypothetical protein
LAAGPSIHCSWRPLAPRARVARTPNSLALTTLRRPLASFACRPLRACLCWNMRPNGRRRPFGPDSPPIQFRAALNDSRFLRFRRGGPFQSHTGRRCRSGFRSTLPAVGPFFCRHVFFGRVTGVLAMATTTLATGRRCTVGCPCKALAACWPALATQHGRR